MRLADVGYAKIARRKQDMEHPGKIRTKITGPKQWRESRSPWLVSGVL
jgi:hypothetical protein